MRVGAALLGAAAVLALSTPANAGRLSSWYGVFEGGGTALQDFDIQTYVTPAPVPATSTLTTEIGWAALASVGYAYNNGWRVELEGGYRHNEFEDRIVGGVAAPVDGSLGQYTLMANVLYDFPSASGVTFTLGGGVGADYGRFDGSSFAVQPVEDDQVSLAFQAIAGLSYQVNSWLDVVLNYRYLYVTDFEFSEVDALVPANTNHVDTDALQSHTLTMGLRFGSHKSDAPQVVKSAPPPPPPQAQVARQYVIYFGFNKCNITAEADAVLSEAAGASRTLGSVGVKIVGHTDTVGSRNANQRLSDCRSGAAKSNLVSKGVPSGAIQTMGAGETQLLVQTGDNVKEPQNRRATIDLN